MTGRERLKVLRNALAQGLFPEVKIDMSEWINLKKGMDLGEVNPANLLACTSTACAVGVAMLLPELQKEGLQAVPTVYYDDYDKPNGGIASPNVDLGEFFGIPDTDASYIFHGTYEVPDHEVTRAMIVDRIDQVLEKGPARTHA